MNKHRNSEVEEDTSWPKRARSWKDVENQMLLLICTDRVLCVDISKCSTHAYNHELPPPELPVSFDLGLARLVIGGWFEDKKEISILGGCPYGMRIDRKGDVPYALLKLMTNSNSSSAVEVVATTTLKGMTIPVGGPLSIRVGRKVYFLDSMYNSTYKNELTFKEIDLDSCCLRSLPQPPFLENCSDTDKNLWADCSYVIGSRFFVLLGIGVDEYHVYRCDDAKAGKWTNVTCSFNSWFGRHLYVPNNARCVTVSGLNHKVLLSYFYPRALDDQVQPKLFAILITDMGRPICYQEIFDKVHIFPYPAVTKAAAIADVGGGKNSVAATFYKDGKAFISVCFFELFPSDDAAAFDGIAEDELGGGDDLPPQEAGFLEVQVCYKFISGFNKYHRERVRAASLM